MIIYSNCIISAKDQPEMLLFDPSEKEKNLRHDELTLYDQMDTTFFEDVEFVSNQKLKNGVFKCDVKIVSDGFGMELFFFNEKLIYGF